MYLLFVFHLWSLRLTVTIEASFIRSHFDMLGLLQKCKKSRFLILKKSLFSNSGLNNTSAQQMMQLVRLRVHTADATQPNSWVASASAACMKFAPSCDGFGRKIENWTCWEFIQSSWLQNLKLGHDCRRMSTHRPTQLNSTLTCSVFDFFAKSVAAVVVR